MENRTYIALFSNEKAARGDDDATFVRAVPLIASNEREAFEVLEPIKLRLEGAGWRFEAHHDGSALYLMQDAVSILAETPQTTAVSA